MTDAPKTDVLSLVETHRDTLNALIAEADNSEAGRLLARRAAALATWCDSAELLMSQGRKIDMATYLKALGTLNALLTDAGKARAAQPIEGWGVRDLTERDLARSILYQHHMAKIAGKLHLLPEPVLDLVASVQPTPEATHVSTPAKH